MVVPETILLQILPQRLAAGLLAADAADDTVAGTSHHLQNMAMRRACCPAAQASACQGLLGPLELLKSRKLSVPGSMAPSNVPIAVS